MSNIFIAPLIWLVASLALTAADFATDMQDATFKLFNVDSTATCFFVRGEATDTALYLVTAAHVLERAKGDTDIVVLRQLKDDGSFARLDHTIPIRRDGKPLWVRHEKQDVAVLRCADPFPLVVPALPASALIDTARLKALGVHICSPFFVLTYPQRFEANQAGFPVARQGIIASPPLLPLQTSPTFLGDFTTFAGDSGGPVFMAGADGKPKLIGIVLAQSYHDESVKTDYEERTLHYPLGIGTILHAQFVCDTLELAVKGSAPATK